MHLAQIFFLQQGGHLFIQTTFVIDSGRIGKIRTRSGKISICARILSDLFGNNRSWSAKRLINWISDSRADHTRLLPNSIRAYVSNILRKSDFSRIIPIHSEVQIFPNHKIISHNFKTPYIRSPTRST